MSDQLVENPEFDHLLHWVNDVPAAVAAYRGAGLPAHENAAVSGFHNGGWRLDERYVEILTVTDDDALRSSRYADGLAFLRPAIDALGGSGGAITFAVNVRDAQATAVRLRRQGFEVAEFAVTLAEHGVSFVEIFVLNAPAWAPFFITYDPPRHELLAGIDPTAFEHGRHDLVSIVLDAPDPEGSAELLATMVGVARDGLRVPLPGANVEFELGEKEAITTMTLSGEHPGNISIDGLALRAAA